MFFNFTQSGVLVITVVSDYLQTETEKNDRIEKYSQSNHFLIFRIERYPGIMQWCTFLRFQSQVQFAGVSILKVRKYCILYDISGNKPQIQLMKSINVSSRLSCNLW